MNKKLNSRSLLMIENIYNGFCRFPKYDVECVDYQMDDADAKCIDVYLQGKFCNRYLFYPNPDGSINSICLYGMLLQQHCQKISASMNCFGLKVTKIFYDDKGLNPFLDIYIAQY